MKRTQRDRLELVQGLLYTASTELKAIQYEGAAGEAFEVASNAEGGIDRIVAELNRYRMSLPVQRKAKHMSWLFAK